MNGQAHETAAPAPPAAARAGQAASERTGAAGEGTLQDVQSAVGNQAVQAAVADPAGFELSVGRLEGSAGDETIHFDKIAIPEFKFVRHGKHYAAHPLHRIKAYSRGNPAQRKKWLAEVQPGAAVKQALKEKREKKFGDQPGDGQYVFAAPAPKAYLPNRFFIGSLDTIARELSLPSWDRTGVSRSFDVDHIVELQLAGWSKGHVVKGGFAPNELPNMELLDSSANSSSGSQIKASVERRVRTFLEATAALPGYPRGAEALLSRFHLSFDGVEKGAAEPQVGPNLYWTREEIERGDHALLEQLRSASPTEVGREDELLIFSQPTGGVAKKFKWEDGKTKPVDKEPGWLKPLRIISKRFAVAPDQLEEPQLGELTVALPKGNKKWNEVEPTPVPIHRIPGMPYAGHIDRPAMWNSVRRFRKKGASPIQIEAGPEILPEGGIGVRGQIMPEIPALEGVGIDFELSGDELRVWKTFTLEEIKVPRPFKLNAVTLTASAGTESGLALDGDVEFEVERLGSGKIEAHAGTEQGIALAGELLFDPSLFAPPAKVSVWYRGNPGAWGGEGELTIPPDKLPGIRRGSFKVTYAEGLLSAEGGAQTSIPGVSDAALKLAYSEKDGLAIGGKLTLDPASMRGVRGGEIEALIEQRPGAEGYRVKASGRAEPALEGVDAALTVDYDDGALTVEGEAKYERPPLSGQLTLGATNRPVDEQGRIVAAGEPQRQITPFGSGRATVQLTPWLEGSAGLRILPNGEIDLSGSIGLPASVDVFPEQAYEKNIITIGIDIPIVGVAVAGQRIGIFATVAGGLDFSAGVGPGQLQELGLEIVSFKPAKPEETHIKGGAHLHIPAHAGLRLFIRGGLGAGIPIVSATAGLEVGGALGVEGAFDAIVQVDWMPVRGLVLDAEGKLRAEPRFRFDVTGFVLVEADLLIHTIELYSERWRLAAFEFGSGLALGMRFPVHYEEGKPFEMSWSDATFELPEVNPREVLASLLERIA